MQRSQKTDVSRRRLLKLLATAGGGIAVGVVLPGQWAKPLMRIGVLPAHAAASAVSTVTPTASPPVVSAPKLPASHPTVTPTEVFAYPPPYPSTVVTELPAYPPPYSTATATPFSAYPTPKVSATRTGTPVFYYRTNTPQPTRPGVTGHFIQLSVEMFNRVGETQLAIMLSVKVNGQPEGIIMNATCDYIMLDGSYGESVTVQAETKHGWAAFKPVIVPDNCSMVEVAYSFFSNVECSMYCTRTVEIPIAIGTPYPDDPVAASPTPTVLMDYP